MNPTERWSRIDQLFRSLFEMPADERQRALEAVEDTELRAEVGALLAAHEELLSSDGGILGQLDPVLSGALLEEAEDPTEETTIGRYRILRRLGSGGMGVVYQAYDPRLERSVALKLLPPYLSADPAAVRRLAAEARAASALDHPNIETVYEIGETEDDRLFIAMAYYEGETLRERITRAPTAIAEALDLGVQLAEGLNAAHRSGIIHRDIKPENLVVTTDGILKIVDFGVATVVKEGLASAGLPRGTAVYMSPEQTRGEAVDHRTDLWSAGVVLYEILAGSRPFGGEGAALIHAIRHDRPPPLSAVRPDAPPALSTTVERCLEKDRDRRVESAKQLAEELRAVATGTTIPAAGSARRPASRARRQLASVAGTTLLAAIAVGLSIRSGGEAPFPTPVEAAAPGIAILPFEVRGEGLEVWREGMVDLLSVALDGAADLRAIDSRTVLARWRELAPDGVADLTTSMRVAQASGARYAIMGSVVPIGADVRLVAEVYEGEGGRRLGQAQVEGSQVRILQHIDQLAIQSLELILERDQGLPEIDLASLTSASLPAIREYLGGEVHMRRGEYSEAVAAYDRAIAADSTFALGWFGVAQALARIEASSNPRGPEAIVRALSNPRLPERERLLARAFFQDGTVVGPLRAAVRRHPDDARLWFALGTMYFYQPEIARVGPEEAVAAYQRAIKLDPGFAPSWVNQVKLAFFVDPDSASIGRTIEAYGRETSDVRGHRLAHDLAFGNPETRARARASFDVVDDQVLLTAWLDLLHPRYYDELFPMLEALVRRAPPHWKPAALAKPGRLNLGAGRVRTGLDHVFDPRIEDDPRYMYCAPYGAFARGLPVPAARLDARMSTAVIDSTTGLWIGCVGAWAADRGRWEEHARVREATRDLANRALSLGDSIGFLRFQAIDRALEGYMEWKRGRREEALRLLDAARPSLGPYTSDVALPHGWWTAQILLELGRLVEAASYFRTQWFDPLAHYELAKIYDQLGEDAKARGEYEFFISAWSQADPELQPIVERAREDLSRLLEGRRSQRP